MKHRPRSHTTRLLRFFFSVRMIELAPYFEQLRVFNRDLCVNATIYIVIFIPPAMLQFNSIEPMFFFSVASFNHTNVHCTNTQ